VDPEVLASATAAAVLALAPWKASAGVDGTNRGLKIELHYSRQAAIHTRVVHLPVLHYTQGSSGYLKYYTSSSHLLHAYIREAWG
jgi:hypothetical protein